MISIQEYIDLNNDTYPETAAGTQVSNGWTVLPGNKFSKNPGTGFYARAYQKGDDIVISYRGTNDANDWSFPAEGLALQRIPIALGNTLFPRPSESIRHSRTCFHCDSPTRRVSLQLRAA
jgi:hypothetical protein